MCTAVFDNGMIGRTLDLELSYGEVVAVMPRGYRYSYKHENYSAAKYAMIGVACVSEGIPLYYDGINEAGLGAAALNFPGFCAYHNASDKCHAVASYELIPWILGQCETVGSAKKLLQDTVITGESFSDKLPSTSLHWMIADACGAIVVESTVEGLMINDDPPGVLTNSPPFPYHMARLAESMGMDSRPPENRIAPGVILSEYSRGMGAIGLPGDYSSSSRFVKATFIKNHTTNAREDSDRVNRFFRIMDTVSVPKGCVKTREGKDVYTVYTSCGDLVNRRYCFTAYDCRRITSVSLGDFITADEELIIIEMPKEGGISFEYKIIKNFAELLNNGTEKEYNK